MEEEQPPEEKLIQYQDIKFDKKRITCSGLKTICREIRKRVRPKEGSKADSGQDYKIVITGGTGSGKSWIGLLVGVLTSDHYDLAKNIAYYSDSGELIKKFNILERFESLNIDEAIMALDKMSFANKEYRDIVKLFNTERYQNKIIIMCIPGLENLGKDIREHEVDMWINIIEHGVCTVHSKPRVMRSAVSFLEVWDNFKKSIKRKKLYEFHTENIVNFFEKHNTHLITIRDVPSPEDFADWYNEYNRLKVLSRKIAIDKKGGVNVARKKFKKDIILAKLIKKEMEEKKYTQKEFASMYSIDRSYVGELLAGDSDGE